MRSLLGTVAAAAMALGLVACDEATTSASPGINRVVSTTSFGMCVGYCKTTLEIAPGQAVLTREAWGRGAGANLPTQRFTATLSPAEWKDIAQSAAEAKIGGLPDVIGCPDCADGGAETLTIVNAGGEKTIKFDHGADIKEAQALLARVRALRTKLTPAQ